MSASQRPPRRRRSALADEHPAYPQPVPEPKQEQHDDSVSEPAVEAVPDRPEEPEYSRAATRPRAIQPATEAVGTPDTPAGRPEPAEPVAVPSRQAEQRTRAAARNAAWSWAKARTRLDRRVAEWCDEMSAARSAGTAPAVLREYIAEAAGRVGIDLSDVPGEVWQAAGLEPE